MRRGRTLALAIALTAGALLAAAPSPAAAPRAPAMSIGWPNAGKLANGKRVRDSATMRVLPGYGRSPAKWGVPELIDLLDRASRKVGRRHPGAVLGLGELSAERGGPLASHRSHQSGRDADVGFYLVDARGHALRHERFLVCEPDGKVQKVPGARFDDARNWALVAALLEDRRATVRQIFVHASIRARLLAHAERAKAPAALRARAAEVLYQPPNVEAHDDHFHVRIACPRRLAGKGCIDDSRARPGAADARAPSNASDPPAPAAAEPERDDPATEDPPAE